jgi:hypothetical protein
MVAKAVDISKWLDASNKPTADRWAISLLTKDENAGQSRQRVTLHDGGVVIKQPVWNCVSRMPSVKLDMNDEFTPQTFHAKKAINDLFSGM